MATRVNYSSYPSAYDGYGNIVVVRDNVDEIRAQHHNSLRDAVIKIEFELGLNPSGVYATVRDRLDAIGDSSALIAAHIAETVDAHDASAISILDSGGSYVSSDVEGALDELAAVLPDAPDVIGENSTSVPNDGLPCFYTNDGTLHVFNTTSDVSASIVEKTQPYNITGVTIVDVGSTNGNGLAELKFVASGQTLAWKAPGDSTFPTGTAIGAITDGTETILTSVSGKSIRVVTTNASLPVVDQTDTFEIFDLSAASGTFSIDGEGFQDTTKITRTAIASDDPDTRKQFVISGIVYPADRGTLVLQRKLRLSIDSFLPIAVLDLGANYDSSKASTGQPAYVPTFSGYDTITLFDRLPVRGDYENVGTDASGSQVYQNFSVSRTYSPFQLAKYLIPVSNDSSSVTNGEIDELGGIDTSDTDYDVSSYRLVHYIEGQTSFVGDPTSSQIYSVVDPFGGVSDGDSTMRMGNLVVDGSGTRPGFGTAIVTDSVELTPTSNYPSVEKKISGIRYYNGSNDEFDLEVESDTNLFNATYLREDILRFSTNCLTFPSGSTYGLTVDVDELEDSFGNNYSSSNLPDFGTVGKNKGYYLINSANNPTRRPYVDGYVFSARARVSATFYDPFGAGDTTDAYGYGDVDRILVNSYPALAFTGAARASATTEYFTDEDYRVGETETFELTLADDEFTHSDNSSIDQWFSDSALSAGELQCGAILQDGYEDSPGLIFPQDDYTSGGLYTDINPTQSGLVDYSDSSYEVESGYRRLFNLGYATNGGKLRIVSSGSDPVSFNDIDESNPSRCIAIYVKIPGAAAVANKTGFMDIGKLYETGKTSDDDGALAGDITGSAGDFTVPFTFGTKNNADTGSMIAVKIVYAPGGSNVAEAKCKIISMVQLLAP
jgi:hypothetical protein